MGQNPNNIDSDVQLKIDIEKKRLCKVCGREVSDKSVKTCMTDDKKTADEVNVCLNCDPRWQMAEGEWMHSSQDFECEKWKLQKHNKGDSL